MTIDGDLVMVWSTWPDAARADAAARILVERRLVACAVVLPGARSVYRWQGVVETAEEVVMWAKTRRALADAVVAAVVEAHPYDVPAVLVLPVEAAHPAYAVWVGDETAAESPHRSPCGDGSFGARGEGAAPDRRRGDLP